LFFVLLLINLGVRSHQELLHPLWLRVTVL
jgi:hypothetical protein